MSIIFSENDLQGFGDLAVSLAFKDTCDIMRNPKTWDAQGGHIDNWSAVNAQPLPCLVVDVKFPTEMILAEQLTDNMRKMISLPRLTDVRKDDRVFVYGPGGVTTKYHVVGVVEPSTFEVLRRVVGEREDIPR